jgi:hypothetical protein
MEEIEMQREAAELVLKSALSLEREVGRLDSQISRLVDPKEKEEFVQALGRIMEILTRDFVFRIVREHPDLNPDR